MKKVSAFISAFAIAATACSCGSTKDAPQQSYTAEKLSGAAYKKELIKTPEDMQLCYFFETFGGGNEHFILGPGTGGSIVSGWRADSGLENYETADLSEFDIGTSYDICMTENGTIVTVVNHVDFGDLPAVSIYSEEYTENQEKYDAAAEYSLVINTYSTDGTLLSSNTVKDYPADADKSTMVSGAASDGEYVIAGINGTDELFKIDGTYVGELTAGEGEAIKAIGRSGSGEIICAVDMDGDKMQLRTVNTADGTLNESNTTYDFTETPQEIAPAYGEYSVYIRTRSTIYGIRSDNSDIESLFSVAATGVNNNNVNGFCRLPDGNFVIIETDYSAWTVKMKKFIAVDPEELANIPTLTIGIEGESHYRIEEIVNKWNDENSHFQVEVKNYEYSYDDPLNNELTQDILSDNLPDIILSDSISGKLAKIDLRSYGALCDLYEFMDNDDEFTRDKFIPNVLANIECDGEVVALPSRFSLDLGTVAKTKFVGDGSDWNIDKNLDILENPPIEIVREQDTKYLRRTDIDWQIWIDYDNAACNFNSESFIRYLNYCNGAKRVDTDESMWSNYEDMTAEERDALVLAQNRAYIDDTEIFDNTGILTYVNYTTLTKGQFGGEPITFLGSLRDPGEPDITMDFFESFSITKSSKHKELAWEFIKAQLNDEDYKDSSWGGFPVTKSGLEVFKADQRKPQDYSKLVGIEDCPDFKDYHGLVYYLTSFLGDGLKIGEITDEDVAAVDHFIETAKRRSEFVYPDYDFYTLIYEEFDRFFYGECTAEQCAEALQDRCSTYLAEQYS